MDVKLFSYAGLDNYLDIELITPKLKTLISVTNAKIFRTRYKRAPVEPKKQLIMRIKD